MNGYDSTPIVIVWSETEAVPSPQYPVFDFHPMWCLTFPDPVPPLKLPAQFP
jgi:hypothetical protein